MKLNSISALNFMRIGEIDVDLSDSNIHLFAGLNESGKSTLQEAIRFACFGETVRVSKKGDYKLMVKDGAKQGFVSVDIDNVIFRRNIATGALSNEDVAAPPDALRYLLDAHLFPGMKSDERRKFLFRALGVGLKPADIKERILKRDIKEECIDAILPMLLSGGFGGAYNETKRKTTEARGVWKGITGETYGSKKGEKWEAEALFTQDNREQLDTWREEVVELETQIEARLIEKGAQQAGKSSHHEGIQLTCPECSTKLVYQMGVVTKYVEQDKEPPPESEIDQILNKHKQRKSALQTEISRLEFIEARDKELDKLTEKAKVAHDSALEWKALEAILAPDGLPAEIISEAITPLNERLKKSSIDTGWKTCQIDATMEVSMDGRPYTLQSESSRWRADAMIAEALSNLTGLGVLVLDRVDVLDIGSRMQLIKWVIGLRDEYNNILLFATLKEPPTMPPTIATHWLENGAISS